MNNEKYLWIFIKPKKSGFAAFVVLSHIARDDLDEERRKKNHEIHRPAVEQMPNFFFITLIWISNWSESFKFGFWRFHHLIASNGKMKQPTKCLLCKDVTKHSSTAAIHTARWNCVYAKILISIDTYAFVLVLV